MIFIHYHIENYNGAPLWVHAVTILAMIALFIYLHVWHKVEAIEPLTVEPVDSYVVLGELKWFDDVISGAATTSELACIQDQVEEWDAVRSRHMDVREYFKELQQDIQKRHNQLKHFSTVS